MGSLGWSRWMKKIRCRKWRRAKPKMTSGHPSSLTHWLMDSPYFLLWDRSWVTLFFGMVVSCLSMVARFWVPIG